MYKKVVFGSEYGAALYDTIMLLALYCGAGPAENAVTDRVILLRCGFEPRK